jgi:hypothetical protein
MKYLNLQVLNTINADDFWSNKPTPSTSLTGALTEDGLRVLRENFPPLQIFKKTVGQVRAYNQRPHDRYELHAETNPNLPNEWKEFLKELEGPEYREFIKRVYRTNNFVLRFQWHAGFAGSSVSPHTDGERKVGSHLFYFNSANDWKEEWGGAIELLDDEGKFSYKSNPEFEDFPKAFKYSIIGNQSLLFARTDHSWHGVRELKCPEGAYRRLFVVVIDKQDKPVSHFNFLKNIFKKA